MNHTSASIPAHSTVKPARTYKGTTNDGLRYIRVWCPPSYLQQTLFQFARIGTVQFLDRAGVETVVLSFDLL